jgi:hypothetical protein
VSIKIPYAIQCGAWCAGWTSMDGPSGSSCAVCGATIKVRSFIDEIVGRRNARNAKRLDLERVTQRAPTLPKPIVARASYRGSWTHPCSSAERNHVTGFIWL